MDNTRYLLLKASKLSEAQHTFLQEMLEEDKELTGGERILITIMAGEITRQTNEQAAIVMGDKDILMATKLLPTVIAEFYKDVKKHSEMKQ